MLGERRVLCLSGDSGGAVAISYPWDSVEGADRMIQRMAEFIKKATKKINRLKIHENKAEHVAVNQ